MVNNEFCCVSEFFDLIKIDQEELTIDVSMANGEFCFISEFYGFISSAFPLMHLMAVGGFIIIQSEITPYFWLNAFTFSV